MELFDIVDRKDKVVGTTDKKTAHATGQLHRVGAVYVFDDAGRLYVQVYKRSNGLYDHSVGGHIAKGETYIEGTRREAKEELGITQPLKEISVFYADEGIKVQHMFGLYSCTAEPTWQFVPNNEVEIIIPMTIMTIRNLMMTNPEKFTRGFINTMSEYVRLNNL
jgi:isopentenyldiphosphate isomerase